MKKIVSAILALVMILSMVSALADMPAGDTLEMHTNLAFPPYEFWDGDEQAGIDIEIAHAIAEKLGYKLEIVDTNFGTALTDVAEGKSNFCMGGVTVTEERKLTYDFSDVYAQGVQVVIVPEGSPITSADDLFAEDTNYAVGTQEATTGYIYMSDDYANCGKDETLVQAFKTGNDAVLALTSGKVDCVVIDNEPAKAFVAANPGLVILETAYVVEDYAAVLPKGYDEFNTAFNAALKELKDEGVLDAIISKYISAE